jgi:hypothetical protein
MHLLRVRILPLWVLIFCTMSSFAQTLKVEKIKKKKVYITFGAGYAIAYRFNPAVVFSGSYLSPSTYRLYTVKETPKVLGDKLNFLIAVNMKVATGRLFFRFGYAAQLLNTILNKKTEVSYKLYNDPNGTVHYKTEEAHCTVSQLDFPIELGFYLNNASIRKAFMVAGITPSYTTGSDGGSFKIFDPSLSNYIQRQYNLVNVGAQLGAGVMIRGATIEVKLTDSFYSYNKIRGTSLRNVFTLGISMYGNIFTIHPKSKRVFYE